jgi:hypothetical protein
VYYLQGNGPTRALGIGRRDLVLITLDIQGAKAHRIVFIARNRRTSEGSPNICHHDFSHSIRKGGNANMAQLRFARGTNVA